MPYAILDNSVRSNLEQERDRLTKDRDSIIKAAVASATIEIDQTLEYLNGLLGGTIAPESNGAPESAPAAPARKARGKAKAPAASPAETPAAETPAPAAPAKKGKAPAKTAAKTKAEKADKAEPKPKRNVKPSVPFDATMKRDFKGLTPAEAVLKVMTDSPKDTFTTDEMIQILYGSLESEKMPEARKRVALMMAHGMRKGTYEKVGDKPSRFKIVAA